MPLFDKKKGKTDVDHNGSSGDKYPHSHPQQQSNGHSKYNNGHGSHGHDPHVPSSSSMKPPKLVFHCQQAHGSPTGLISGFTNVKELYEKIAECYDIPASEVRNERPKKRNVSMTEHLDVTGFRSKRLNAVRRTNFFFYISLDRPALKRSDSSRLLMRL